VAAAAHFDMQIKLLMIGDSGVGKTCLLLRYANDSFSPTFITTIGIDFKIKNIELDGKRIKLQIWDTAGQERFRTITTSYFRGAQGILLVYDVTDRGSFNSITNWVGQIGQHADVAVNKILIGNKCDMEDQRVVSFEEGKQLASEFGIQFFETSAKNDMNVETVQITPQIPPSICRCNLLILETPLMHLRCDCPGIHNCSQGGEKPFST